MAATIRARAAALGAALILAACSHAAAPSAVAVNADVAQNVARAHQEIQTGVRAFGHRAYKIALGHFNAALALDTNSVEARYDRGMTETKLGAYGHAADDLAYVVKARPAWGSARLHLAVAQNHERRYADATRNFDSALRSDGKAWSVWLDDGVSYFELHRYADARKRLARALALAPKSGRAHFWLGMTYAHLHDAAKARAELALAAYSRDVVVRKAARKQLASR